MRMSSRLLLMLLILVVLSSCAGFSRQTRLVGNESELKEMWMPHNYTLNKLPIITLSCSCVSDQLLFIGPYIIIPLPVIPNLLWPFDYASYKKREAIFVLSVKAPPKMLNWDKVTIKALLNGDNVEISHPAEYFSVWSEERNFRLKLQPSRTCDQVEDQEMAVQIDGVPETIKSTIKLRHRWKVWGE